MTSSISARSLIITLATITALGPLSMQIYLPALPAIQDSFSVSSWQAQLVFSAPLAAIAISSLIYGPASDRFGRRPVLFIGLTIFLLGSVICAVSTSIWIRDLFDRETAARMLAYMVTIQVLAPMMAPLLGGVINDVTGWRAIYWFTVIAGFAAIALSYPRVPETLSHPILGQSIKGMFMSFFSLLRVPEFLAYSGQLSFGLGVWMATLGGAPYVVVRVLDRPPTELCFLLLIISAGFMLGTFTTARIATKVGVDRMIIFGSILNVVFGLVMVVLILLGEWTIWAIFLPGTIMAFASGLIMPNCQAAAVSINPRIAGSASGLITFMMILTGAAFAQIVGVFQNETPIPMVMIATVAAILGLLSITVLPRLRGKISKKI